MAGNHLGGEMLKALAKIDPVRALAVVVCPTALLGAEVGDRRPARDAAAPSSAALWP